MAIQEPTSLDKLRSPRILLSAVFAAVVVFLALFVLQAQTSNTASVIVALDEDQVEWPYHDAVRQTATGAIASSADALAVANTAGGDVENLDASMRDGQSYFEVTARGSDADAAAAGIDAVVTWAREQNLAERIKPFDDEAANLNADITSLTSQYEALQGSEDELDRARVIELGSLIAQFERRLVVIDNDRALLLPQFDQVEPAAPVNTPLRPVVSAIGAFLAMLAVLALLEPARNE